MYNKIDQFIDNKDSNNNNNSSNLHNNIYNKSRFNILN